MTVSVLGIRHHGCGSARSVQKALAELCPDIVLIEGAPEADEIISLAAHEEMKPPVAILIYSPEDPKKAVYYPFAEFSPEWQAIRFALKTSTPVRFIDLPQCFQLAESEQSAEENLNLMETLQNKESKSESDIQNSKLKIRHDPLQFAAEAAGFSDGEIWWENLVEMRGGEQTDLFAGILELMTALREEAGKEVADKESKQDELREAFMRQEIRRAQKEGFTNITVICGAWHAPKLAGSSSSSAKDAEKLKNLPKIQLSSTWIPYTYKRLSFASGYGAGISSPEFYHQIWNQPANIAAFWLSRVASLLREQDLDASSASVIEAVRLAENLSVMRGLAAVGLTELNDAVRAVLCFGDDAPLRLIGGKLIVGERMGRVPMETPSVPLHRDLHAAQKRLRFLPEAAQKNVELDLRKSNDLERSQLLHRLNLLDINWGFTQKSTGKGTFKEAWRLEWQPDLEIAVIEANVWGNTIYSAATSKARDVAVKSDKLSDLTVLVQQTLLSDLPEAIEFLMFQLEAKATVSSDIPAMMDALPPLADVLRYGNVRKTDIGAVQHVVDGLVTRICIGLPNATSSLDDEAAEQMYERMMALNNVVSLLQNENYNSDWRNVLSKLADSRNLHGLVAARCVRLMFDVGKFNSEEIHRRINLALSTANEPAQSAAWLEGFLRGSGLILLHNETLLQILNDWVKTLGEEAFMRILPLLRRTFSTFQAPERRQIGSRINNGVSGKSVKYDSNIDTEIDEERAVKVLPLIVQLLGLRKS